jgi:hypothetical protein
MADWIPWLVRKAKISIQFCDGLLRANKIAALEINSAYMLFSFQSKSCSRWHRLEQKTYFFPEFFAVSRQTRQGRLTFSF